MSLEMKGIDIMQKKIRQKPPEKVWADFVEKEGVSGDQLEQFKRYEALLSEWNRVMNLTSVSGLSEIVSRHFSDSLVLRNFLDLQKANLLVDIGSGAGFPGIPLKIIFPHLDIILVEVTKKKQRFLQEVIDELGLEGIEVCPLDWRTFLRKTQSEADYFLARASLDPVEMARMFKPGCAYKNAKLVYWAAGDWEADSVVKKLVLEEFAYTLKRKQRKLVLMGAK